jgi:hypothetical protein
VRLGAGALTLLAALLPAVVLAATLGGPLTFRLASAAVRHGDASTTATLGLAIAAPVLLLTGLLLRRRGRPAYTAGVALLVILLATTVARLPNLVTLPVALYVAATSALALVSLAAVWWPGAGLKEHGR